MVLHPLLRGLALRFVFCLRPRFDLSHAGGTSQTTRAIALLLTLSSAVAFPACARAEEELISGTMREGSLQCDDSRNFRFVIEAPRPIRVWAKDVTMPDTLRDFPGHAPEITARGAYDHTGHFVARLIAARTGYAGQISARLPSCQK